MEELKVSFAEKTIVLSTRAHGTDLPCLLHFVLIVPDDFIAHFFRIDDLTPYATASSSIGRRDSNMEAPRLLETVQKHREAFLGIIFRNLYSLFCSRF